MKDTLAPGIRHTMTYTVPANRTVPHLLPESPGFGQMPEVLATGYMVGIIEWACVEAIADHLDEGELTLGTHVDLTHQSASVPGSVLTIDVEVTAVDDRAITFEIEARDEKAVISTGRHQRGVVERARFDASIARRVAAVSTPADASAQAPADAAAGGQA